MVSHLLWTGSYCCLCLGDLSGTANWDHAGDEGGGDQVSPYDVCIPCAMTNPDEGLVWRES